jgi:hypothetical protein
MRSSDGSRSQTARAGKILRSSQSPGFLQRLLRQPLEHGRTPAPDLVGLAKLRWQCIVDGQRPGKIARCAPSPRLLVRVSHQLFDHGGAVLANLL